MPRSLKNVPRKRCSTQPKKTENQSQATQTEGRGKNGGENGGGGEEEAKAGTGVKRRPLEAPAHL